MELKDIFAGIVSILFLTPMFAVLWTGCIALIVSLARDMRGK